MSVVKREKLLRHACHGGKISRWQQMETSLKKWIRTVWNFIDLVQFHLTCQCWRNVQKGVMHVQSCCFANIRGLFTWKWGTPGRWGNPLRWGKKITLLYKQSYHPAIPGCTYSVQVTKHVNKKKGLQTTCFSDYCSSTFTCCNLQCCSFLYCYR